MSTPGSPPAAEGMYSKLVDDDQFGHRHRAHPGSPVRLPMKLSGPGSYRLAAACLAALCAVLLISLIAVAAHYKNKPPPGAEAASELQTQTQDANITALISTINTLQQGINQLQKEKSELLAKLNSTEAGAVKPAPTPLTCPMSWSPFGTSCYYVSPLSEHWQGGQEFCQNHGAHLAIIHTAEEQTFLWDQLPRGHWNAFWFGITDEQTEDQWKWVDGTPLVGGFWEVGEPNNHINEDCGYIVKTRVLERVAIRSWYDAPCSMHLPFICEKEMGTSNPAAH